jgi:hypothetical protein
MLPFNTESAGAPPSERMRAISVVEDSQTDCHSTRIVSPSVSLTKHHKKEVSAIASGGIVHSSIFNQSYRSGDFAKASCLFVTMRQPLRLVSTLLFLSCLGA